jgi:hypothetical protein
MVRWRVAESACTYVSTYNALFFVALFLCLVSMSLTDICPFLFSLHISRCPELYEFRLSHASTTPTTTCFAFDAFDAFDAFNALMLSMLCSTCQPCPTLLLYVCQVKATHIGGPSRLSRPLPVLGEDAFNWLHGNCMYKINKWCACLNTTRYFVALVLCLVSMLLTDICFFSFSLHIPGVLNCMNFGYHMLRRHPRPPASHLMLSMRSMLSML